MKFQKLKLCAILLGASLFAVGTAQASSSACDAVAGNIVLNCGFETGDLTDWTSGGGNFVENTGYADPVGVVHSGNFGLSYGWVGSMSPLSQTLATNIGSTYDVSFWLNSNGEFTNEVSLSWGGTSIFDQMNIPANGWTQYNFVETASGTSTALTFGLRQDPAWSGLDDIVVTTAQSNGVPEPQSVALIGLGLMGLAAMRRKSRQ